MEIGKVFIYFFILVLKENVLQGDANPLHPTNNNNTLYESMVSKCPDIKLIKDFDKQQVFNTCSIWTKNDENITTVTNTNTTQALCTLYLNNFVSFCTRIHDVKLNINDTRLKLIPDNVTTVDVNQAFNICKNLTKMTTFFPKHPCFKYCIGDDEIFSSQCFLADYYASYNVSSLIKLKNNVNDVTEKDKSKQPAVLDAVAPLPQAKSAPVKNIVSDHIPSSNVVNHEDVVPDSVNNVSNQEQDRPNSNNAAIDAVEMLTSGNGKKPKLTQQVPTNTDDVKPKSTTKNQPVNQTRTDQIIENLSEEQPSNHKPENGQNGNTAEDQEPSHENPKPVKTNTTASEAQSPKEQSSSTKVKTQSVTSVQPKAPTPNNEQANDNPSPNELPSQNDKPAQIENPAQDDSLAPNDNEDILPNEDGDNTDDDLTYLEQNQLKKTTEEKSKAKPAQLDEDIPISSDDIDGESYFFSYFMVVCVLFVLGYVFYHNRTKVMALVIEGKRNRRQFRGKRPNSANYHKLDSNLEEAISSSCTKSKSNVIY